MPHRSPLMVRFVIMAACLIAIICAGCSPRTDDNAFFRQVRTWVPLGAHADDAAAAMRRQGFEVFTYSDPQIGPHLDCSRVRVDVRNGLETQWRAILHLDEEEKISHIETSVQSARIDDEAHGQGNVGGVPPEKIGSIMHSVQTRRTLRHRVHCQSEVCL